MMNKAWIWVLVRIRALAGDKRGVSLVEYALLIAFAILLVLVAIRSFSNAFIEATNFIADEIDNAVNPT